MIDIHSHILPNIDDGSKSVEESLKMLKELSNQGVDRVVATPHFYANHNSVDGFLECRDKSYNKLLQHLNNSLPKVILGAEVKYYEGISRLQSLEKLRISNSKLLLLEMSMQKWSEFTLRELFELSSRGDLTIVLAHIERYLRFQNKDTISRLVESGIYIQSNADFFIDIFSRRKALQMLNNNEIHFIGSDCHNLEERAPKISSAVEYIRKKSGDRFVSKMNKFNRSFFNM